MRKISTVVCFFFAICLSVKCSNDNKAHSEIKEYFKKNLNDPSSYQPVSFSEPLTDSTTYLSDPKLKILLDSEKYWQDEFYKQSNVEFKTDSILLSQMKTNLPEHVKSKAILDSSINAGQRVTDFQTNYRGRPCGFKIIHEYRAKNGFGALTIGYMVFHFDSAYNLLSAEELKDNK